MYVPPGYLLYVRDRTVLAQKFDVERAQLQGDAMTVVSDVADNTTLSATAGGMLALTEVTTHGRLLWLNRAGKELRATELPKPLGAMALSPNNKQLLGHSNEGGNFVVWLIDLDRSVSTQMATDAAFPVWAPDGARFVYTSIRSGEGDLFVRSIAGSSEDVPWLKTNDVKVPTDWSADGWSIVFTNNNQRNVWILPTFGDRKPFPFLPSPSHTSTGRVSPDGRWLAYVSDETGKNEVEKVLEHLRLLGLTLDKTAPALDFGCGVGRLTRALADHFPECWGVDISPTMIRLAEEFNKDCERCHFCLNQTSSLAMFRDEYFAFIYTSIVFQHIERQYVENYLLELIRALKPGGVFVFQIPDRFNAGFLEKLRHKLRLRSRLARMFKRRSDVFLMDMHCIPESAVRKLLFSPEIRIADIQRTNSTDPSFNGNLQYLDHDPDRSYISKQYCLIKSP